MPAAQKACVVCGSAFYGRADAKFCSVACRQRRYRQRVAKRLATTSRHVTNSDDPVPIGDDWMADRFPAEDLLGHQTRAQVRSWSRPLPGGLDQHEGLIDYYEANADKFEHDVLQRYIDAVANIRRGWAAGPQGAEKLDDAPLGDALPAVVRPALAAVWADDLAASLVRIHELLALLRRRATEPDDTPVWVDPPHDVVVPPTRRKRKRVRRRPT